MNQARSFSGLGGMPQDGPLIHKSWHNPTWPPNVLNPDNIIIYFCDQSNPFYDSQSDNQQLIMQGLPMDRLSKMTGYQFSLVHTCGPLFVIGKYKRTNEFSVQPLCYYYVMDGTVYQCPDMYTFIQSRLAQTVNPLREALIQASKYSKFDVNKGYSWDFGMDASKSSDTIDEEKEKKAKKSWYQDPNKVRSTQYQSKRADKILQMTIHRYPPGNGMKVVDSAEMEATRRPGPASISSTSRHTPMPQQIAEPGSINTNVTASKPATPASNLTGPVTPMTGGVATPGGFHAALSAPNSHPASMQAGPSSVPSRMTNASPAMRKGAGTPNKLGR